jgi:glycosyltransferase involved in cell wall biosynthesis
MRAVLITLTYPPEPASQLHDLLKDLKVSYNVDSCIITSVPSYPIGKVYKGYKNSFSVETVSDLTVYRGPIFPSQSKNIFHRGLFYLSNLLSSISILFFRKKFKDEIFIVYQPPISSFLAFFFFNLFFKRKFIFWINDMWPETLVNFGIKNKFILFIIDSIYKNIYFTASKIVVLSPGFKNILLKKGIHEKKIEIIYNWNSSNYMPPYKTNSAEGFKMIYAGNLGKFQKLDVAIFAIHKLRLEGFKISFDIYGTGTEFEYLNKILI